MQPAMAESGPKGCPGAQGPALLGLNLAWVPEKVCPEMSGYICFYARPAYVEQSEINVI